MFQISANINKPEGYELRRNPFPYVGIPEGGPIVYAGRESQLSTIADAVSGVLKGSSSHVVIVGNYGSGKTKTLKIVKQELTRQLGESVIVAYTSNPGETFIELYRNLADDIGEKRVRDLVWQLLARQTGKTELKSKVEKGEALLSEILPKCKNDLYADFGHTDFVNGLIQLALEEHRYDAWKYVSGEPLLFENKRVLDVLSSIDNDDRAMRALISMLRVFQKTGVKMVCILIDELEAIQVMHPWKKQRLLNNIRRLVDLNPAGLCIIMSCAPEAWSEIVREYHAFSERIFREVVLPPLDIDGATRLIESYLNLERVPSKKSKNSLHPFTTEVVEEMLVAAQGNTRRLLMICNRTIDEGAREGCPPISKAFLKKKLPEVFAPS